MSSTNATGKTGEAFPLPAKTNVKATITSQNCDYLQRTVIGWPDGSKSDFTTAKAAGKNNLITYGTATFMTGSGTQQATVEVFDRQNTADPWVPTHLRIDKAKQQVQSDGHPATGSRDWNDTIVTFTW